MQEISPEDYDSEKDGLPSANTYADETAGHTYTYTENGNLTSETNRLGITTDYLYNDVGAKIRESFDIYEFNYTDHGEISNVIIAGNTYATYNYDENLLESIEYGNDQTVFYEYNDFGQVTSQKYRDNDNAPTETQYEYTYTEDAEDIDDSVLTSKIDYRNNQITEYDGNTVTISNFEIVDDEISITELYYSYEESEDIAEEDSSEASPQYLNQSFADTSFNTTFNEDCDVFTKDNEEICRYNYQYDASGELLSTSITNTVDGEDNTILNTTYEYNEKGYITKMTNTFANGEIVSTYSYDDLGRLIEYHPDESSVAYYVYDSKGQLVREDYQFGLASATVTYKYDSRGNIETIKQYPFTRGDITQAPEETENLDFEYDDGIWLDVLSEIGDNPLLYDSQGNLINLTDCDVNWTNGRQLSSYSYTNEDGVTEDIIKYNYDENGIRISKEYDGITTYYTTIDGRITSQYEIDETGTKQNEMIFMYNSLNEIIGVQYEGYNYYYLKNAMGDVIGIIDELESHLTIYYCDAWGNHTSGSTISFSSAENSSLSHKLDEINPMRYRGYYLDSELNFFYLQSRYYASDWCRFINADLPEYAQIQKNLTAGTNLFAYCNNDPVNNSDPTGYFSFEKSLSVIAILSTIYSAISILVGFTPLRVLKISKYIDLALSIIGVATNIYNCIKKTNDAKNHYGANSQNYKKILKYNIVICVLSCATYIVSYILGRQYARQATDSLMYYMLKIRTYSIFGMLINVAEIISGRSIIYVSRVKSNRLV